MRSAAHFRGHPIHPALIPFPIAFLIGAFVADVIGVITQQPAFWTTGAHLAVAGVAMALLAAIPGLIDYTRTIPPRSSARKRGTLHMIAALTAVAAFAISLLLRDGLGLQPQPIQLILEGIGSALLGTAGYMGGTLAFRNQIGVDHRYANSGKWNAVRLAETDTGLIEAARESELGLNQMKLVSVNGKRIVLARSESGLVAFADHCTHKGGSLAAGAIMCDTVQCPWHGSQFDVRTGVARTGPAQRTIPVYAVSIANGSVWINTVSPTNSIEDDRAERQVPFPVERTERAEDTVKRLAGDDAEARG